MDADSRFLIRSMKLLAVLGVLMTLWPLLDSMTPAADAAVPTVINLSTIAPGERRTINIGRTAFFVVHRTPDEIAAVRADDDAPMPSPQPDAERVLRDEWLVVEARPENSFFNSGFHRKDRFGKYGGWYAPYGDHHYDLSGRLREGWRTTKNLPVPDYYFLNDTILVIE